MRNNCVFKDNASGICTFPKLIRHCAFCISYLKNDGNIEQNLKYINFVLYKKMTSTSLFISCCSLLISFCSLIVVLLKLLESPVGK